MTDAGSPVVSADSAPAVSAVAAARARLAALDRVATAEHVSVFDEVHDVLQTTLAGLDER